jgi:cytochrome c
MKPFTWRAMACVGFALAVVAAPPRAGADAKAQIERGTALFAKHCARCHGATGQGTSEGPRLVGKEALPLKPGKDAKLRRSEFRTAKDVAGFVVENMPGDKPGSLKAEEYLAILAFALDANGVELEQELDLEAAGTIVLH